MQQKYKEGQVRYMQHVLSKKVHGACNLKYFNQARHIKCMRMSQWNEDT